MLIHPYIVGVQGTSDFFCWSCLDHVEDLWKISAGRKATKLAKCGVCGKKRKVLHMEVDVRVCRLCLRAAFDKERVDQWMVLNELEVI